MCYMPQHISISTKKGDSGTSFLADGSEHSKASPVFAVLGSLDELNSHIGLVVALIRQEQTTTTQVQVSLADLVSQLERIQHTIYTISALLARAPKVAFKQSELTSLERFADDLQLSMADGWTTQFLYPGGTVVGAHLDIARSVCRTAERLHWEYLETAGNLSEKALLLAARYLNRVSDFLFIARCFVNMRSGIQEKQFTP